ncbi:MAG: dolichyl-phosphate beta-glucosyltransferase [Patescibacteria group bacterium]|nr:dolichyl-phosphate beta-glucosyltransferase [Patescibacteria group bacterium]
MEKEKIKLSVVIPAYNEEKRIGPTILDVDRYLSSQDYVSEILVVIDGATDKTAQVVKKYEGMVQNLRIIDNPENHGKGYVVRQGLLEARGQFRLFMDADNSTTVDHIAKAFPHFEKGFSLVIGSRDIKGSEITEHQARWKELLGNLGNLMIQFLGGLWGIPDTQCGFKVLSSEATRKICPLMRIDRWGFDIEMLVLAKRLNFKIKEFPVEWKNDAESKVSLGSYFQTFKELLQVRFNVWTGKYGK